MSRRRLILNLSSLEKKELESIIIETENDPRIVQRCRIILMTEEGVPLQDIAERLGLCKATANTWRQIFKKKRIHGLTLRKRIGRPPKLCNIVGSHSERLIREYLKQVKTGENYVTYRSLD